jgi:hypothetical protein
MNIKVNDWHSSQLASVKHGFRHMFGDGDTGGLNFASGHDSLKSLFLKCLGLELHSSGY